MMINLFSRRNPSQTEEEAPFPKHRSTRKQLTAKETADDDASSKKCWWKTGCARRRRRREIQASKQSKRDKIVIICNTNMHFFYL
jgi:isopropylmalate/homocitrate/citramalate synthase